MTASSLYLKIIQRICDIVGDEKYCRRSVKKETDFTRRRKMSFIDYIYAILQNAKTGLQTELNAFFENNKNKRIEYSKQAFSKGRQRLKPEAILELFQEVVLQFYKKAELTSWKGYHLFGIDGTRLNLPCTNELAEHYGVQTSNGPGQVQALVSCVYDLLNGMIVDTRFAHCLTSERDAALDMVSSFRVEQVQHPVFVMDRGYPSAELMNSIDNLGKKFVMRCSKQFVRGMELPERDNVIEHKSKKLEQPMKLRILKVELPNGEMEYLATNIFDSSCSVEDFAWLYKQRWGIESKYNDVKNKLEIENFSGYSPDAILQDFYATMFLNALAGVLQYDLHEEIEAAHTKPENKYAYKMNITATISELKKTVIQMLYASSRAKRLYLFQRMQKHLAKAVIPVRPNRSVPRVRRHKSNKFPQNLKRC